MLETIPPGIGSVLGTDDEIRNSGVRCLWPLLLAVQTDSPNNAVSSEAQDFKHEDPMISIVFGKEDSSQMGD
jgi:hypothetical protein